MCAEVRPKSNLAVVIADNGVPKRYNGSRGPVTLTTSSSVGKGVHTVYALGGWGY